MISVALLVSLHTRCKAVCDMDVEQLSKEDCLDLLEQTKTNLDALINVVIAPKSDVLSRQDVATMLILIRDAIEAVPDRFDQQ